MGATRSSASVLANRYATAIFSLATEAKQEALIVEEFSAVARAVEAHAELSAALASPLLDRAAKAEILVAVAKKASPATQQAVRIVAEQGRADVLGRVAQALRSKLARANGEIEAVVESARPLAESVQKQLAESLSKATGKKVQLTLQENPELLGGVAVQIGSQRLDASLSAALNTMRKELLAPTNA
ncbi:MAG: ATP synthase F1 subunit delta [Azospirillum brasilense]|nr:MAG: ATP synthase F1 subunit delta [Azospirillum brasilense]